MGRRATGWRVRLPKRSKTWTVYWWSTEEQRQIELSTGETDAERATAAAPKIYADHTQGKLKSRGTRPRLSLALEEVGVDWIAAMKGTIADNTLEIYSIYIETHLTPFFITLDSVTTPRVREYITKRLSEVEAQTVRKELSPLRGMVAWAFEKELISEEPLIPSVRKRAVGTPYTKKRRAKAVALSTDEVAAFIDALPEKTKRLGVVRDRFVVTYEMALRSTLVDRMESPKHWYPGSKYLELNAASMKGREESKKRLTDIALAALERSYRGPGLIYGHHDYRGVVQAAKEKAIPAERRERFNASHLRSGGITHYAAKTDDLRAIQRYADHKLATTTNLYLRPTEKSNEDELRRQGRIKDPNLENSLGTPKKRKRPLPKK